MNPDIIVEICIAGATLLVNIGITKQKVDDMKKAVENIDRRVSAQETELSRRIFECREESLKHAQGYVSRDEFFKSMSELSRDIKTLMRMVGRKAIAGED